MDMQTHPAINEWGRKKYKLSDDAVVLVNSETISGGYCETCYYTEEVIKVYALENGATREVGQLYDDMASLLREILGDTK